MLLLARRLCDVLGLVSPFRGGTRSRAVVTLCTVRVKGRRRLRCWAALRSPFLTATWHATCQVWRSATHSLWRAPCVAAVAMAPLALILVCVDAVSCVRHTAPRDGVRGAVPPTGYRAPYVVTLSFPPENKAHKGTIHKKELT